MEYVSSDTNVWIDFLEIDRLELPFRLPCTFIMSKEAAQDELLSPPGLCEKLISYGLLPVDITVEEFFLAEQYGQTYKRLSTYDCLALAIAKARNITLLTGDGALRKAADQEGVPKMGTLTVPDKLLQTGAIDANEMLHCLNLLKMKNGKAIRLPVEEIGKRIDALSRK